MNSLEIALLILMSSCIIIGIVGVIYVYRLQKKKGFDARGVILLVMCPLLSLAGTIGLVRFAYVWWPFLIVFLKQFSFGLWDLI